MLCMYIERECLGGIDQRFDDGRGVSVFGIQELTVNDHDRHLKSITNREVSCYSISAKNQVNIDVTLQWLIKKGKGQK